MQVQVLLLRMVHSYNGYYAPLSREILEFDSPMDRHAEGDARSIASRWGIAAVSVRPLIAVPQRAKYSLFIWKRKKS